MTRMSFRTAALVIAALGIAACHKAPAPAPAPTAAPAADNSAAEARARAAAARADSIARADAARRDAAAREAAARSAREAAAARATLAAAIYFDLDKDALRTDAEQTLDAKVAVLKSQGTLHIRIDGNADDRGSDEYNLALSQRRAASAKRYLEARGIDSGRLEVVSFGKERPECKDENESCWQQNRHDGFSVTSGAATGGANR